jgi:hypothetical protein
MATCALFFYFFILKMVISTRALFLFAVLCLVFVQTTYASVFSQLQFIKISSPKNGQDVRAGKTVVFKYVMQPLIKSKIQIYLDFSDTVN